MENRMSNTKHTPTPWFTQRDSWSTVYIEARIRPGTLQEIAACGPTENGSDEQEANAAFIVRACNAHEQLVDALRQGRVAIDVLMAQLIEVDPSFKPTQSAAWPALVAIKAALEKVEA
jgi:hypothetical protein